MARYNDNIAAVAGLKYAAGIYIPNHNFGDINSSVHTGTRTGEDGKTWTKTAANHWYSTGSTVTTTSDADSDDMYLGHDQVAMVTASTSSTADLDDHILGAATLYSEMLPWSSLYASHTGKRVQAAFVAKIDADVVEGSHFRIALAQFDSSYAYLAVDYFDLSGVTIGTDFTANTATTSGSLHGSTAYVQVHIGLHSPDGAATVATVADLTLMIDPTSSLAADVEVDLGSVYLSGAPGMAWSERGVRDRMTLEGVNHRTNTLKGAPKYQFSAQWHQEDEDAYDLLRNAWLLSVGKYISTVPEPVPLCCNFGVGMAPFWAYYDITGSTFNGTFTNQWTVAGQRFDVGLNFVER